MAAASLPSFFSVQARGPYLKFKRSNIRRGPQIIKVQNYQDEGRSTNIDANLNVLKKRIEMVRVKERLERCCKSQHGWNYVPVSDHRITKGSNKEEFSLIEFTGLVCGTLGLTCFGGTLFIYLVSLVVHLQL
ncbi:hypothetical protein AAZX31_18G273600 [Glycine max]|uniref:Uncharacterized protein n=2 Tax=Glycine subgen. Soja TaxID=1462606 RepID=I1N584_SOYBN|nr:uncharacterized protein LOC100796879 [Glycine max]XP_028213556.1 uncharacterized protein LOC114395886 [Glycine soja]KAG4922947.1 hypothetical protein JHK86_051760 [Glycine max]KAG4926117.1 hypothetical protein JHK87_051657 [Glycine soja]KAG4937697.1 hypothetical protein JHK85_052616 [Glycine max]KAG5093146.1 hypothetical protein JHK82_051924 [Glycine max]KAG5096213.1 hypothetical protein JHK84_051801 [Glycine max]|eukprot:XP_003552708.1 uncharacterized protein LOC100796879 [Glycine max]